MRTTILALVALLVACEGDVSPPSTDQPHDLTAAAASCFAGATAGGETKVCASCECGSCPAETAACVASGDAARDAKCGAVAACANEKACTGNDCYCGAGLSGLLCFLWPAGPCVAEIDAAIGGHGLGALDKARKLTDSALPRAEALTSCARSACAVACAAPGAECHFDDLACQDRYCQPDAAREAARAASAQLDAEPVITSISSGGQTWTPGQPALTLTAGAEVTIVGHGFGAGPDVDFAKLLVGNSRVLETDLRMFEQKLDLGKQVNYETATTHSTWNKDLLSWSDGKIVFRVPVHASRGPITIQVQKRLPANESLLRPGEPHLVVDAQTLRIKDPFPHTCDVVSDLGPADAVASAPVNVNNPGFAALVALGRQIFWSYDYNIGVAHNVRGLDWKAILEKRATDPMVGGTADPEKLFGAYPTVAGQVPAEAIDPVYFKPYPQPNPIPGFLAVGPQKKEGWTRGTGYVGYRTADGVNPFTGDGAWAGFNCSSCHGARITYEKAPGQTVTRIFPGLPNPLWTIKWAVLGNFKGVKAEEEGPRWAPGKAAVDKTALLYSLPQGTGEHNVVRLNGEGSHTDNDYQWSPITIPNVTNYMPIRRSLSHTESYVGFEGSYIHSEEPDGAMGSMDGKSLQALTAYMTTLDENDQDLRRVGLHRWLEWQGLSSEANNVSEGTFVQTGWDAYPTLKARLARGAQIYAARCGDCHVDGVGVNTNERMVRLDEVGRFFAPTIYQKEMQAIRVTFLRDLYWVQQRGLLSDGHVRNLRDLVDPARCTPGSPLYNAYYTLHAPADPGPAGPDFPVAYPATGRRGDVFRVPRAPASAGDAGAQRNRFIERHKYFVTVPWDSANYYWDFQKMRAEYGPAELGSAGPIGLPAVPHGWCAGDAGEVDDLVAYLLTL